MQTSGSASSIIGSTTGRPVALVTGGTRGLGLAIAKALSSTHHVIVGGRTLSAAETVAAELPDASTFVADLADAAQTERAAERLEGVDVVVHCAGIVPPEGAGVRVSWRRVLEVNVVAVVHLTELLLPTLRECNGLVVFVNSGSGLAAMGDVSGYSASKFALTSYADGLRDAERGRVRVSSLHPGRIDTDMQRDLQGRAGRAYEPTDHMTASSVASAVRAIVDVGAGSVIESLSIRPMGRPTS